MAGREGTPIPSAAVPGAARGGRRVARELSDQILRGELPVGTRLGAEPELLARFGISRSTLREAIRILEHDGIAAARRGPGGGLYVTAPDSAVVAHAAAVWLSTRGATDGDLAVVRGLLESRAAEWATQQADEGAAQRLRGLIQTETRYAAAHDDEAWAHAVIHFHEEIAAMSGNPVVELIVAAMCTLEAEQIRGRTYTDEEMERSRRHHEEISEAIIGGDAAQASRLMLLHLQRAYHHASTRQDPGRAPRASLG